ncbi:serine hydrolase [Neolewinella aurantiaca]|uniref:Serine hydrolase n=1 Tax=Neolewinella aurantiaca TaxID=2602767 RepID=A0A5C7FNG4_9BACT|nr:serine hydrolase [Neolewinella aurantiaca]TXF91765.1 serine hydrolase [Neolewinella aurantiaca]
MKVRFIYLRNIAVFILFCLPLSGSGQPEWKAELLDEKLEAIREATKTVGYSVAVVRGDKVIYAKGFGYRDLAQQLKADVNTVYPIGSTSKAFTVALLGLMVEEKGLKFSDSPRKYLPELEFYNDDLNANVTILDMVSHRTGLPRHDYSWYLFPTENRDSLLARVKYQEPFTGLREQWHYNNFMYLAQGMITEKLTGKSWEENIEERFFAPLKMVTSSLNIEGLKQQKNAAKGYSLKDFTTNELMPYYNIAAISPAGSINSSVGEMANWLRIWLNEGKLDDTQVLPKSYLLRAVNPLMLVGTGMPDANFPDQHLNSYGYAWFVSSYKGQYRMEHGGNIDGFSANVSIFPANDLGIVVLANQNGSALPALARDIIADEFLGLKATDRVAYYNEMLDKLMEQQKTAKANKLSSRVANTSPSHTLNEYTGVYHHPGYGAFSITLKNDSLWGQLPREKIYLKHLHYDVFETVPVTNGIVADEEDGGLNLNFQANDQGDITGAKIKLEPTLDPISFTRTPTVTEVSSDVLASYAGSYALAGAALKVSLADGGLTLLVPGQPEYTLSPVSKNEFVIKGLPGYKAKFDTTSSPVKLILIQPNGTFSAEKQ